jgi:AcrR family transcriptional regulator
MNTTNVTAPKKSFKVQMLAAREAAIIQSVNRLLSEKGFDAMTVDEVAAEVGIAKASLYKHFTSKEELACAAMVTAMRRAQEVIQSTDSALPPLDNTQAARPDALTAQPELHLARHLDGQQGLHGRLDGSQRRFGRLD